MALVDFDSHIVRVLNNTQEAVSAKIQLGKI